MSRSSDPPDEDRYRRLLEVQETMARVSREIGPALDLEQVLATILEAMRSLVDCEGGTIILLDGDRLAIAASHPEPPPQIDPHATVAPDTIAGRVYATGRSAVVEDMTTDPRIRPASQAVFRRTRLLSCVCVPLVVLGEAIGALTVASSKPGAFTDEHRILLEGLATQVAGAIESARRYRMITELEVLKSDFIARVSHELRTPITIMSGFVSTLLTAEDLDPALRRQMLERVDVATARLSGLIDQLLMLSRLEAGVVAATIERVNARSVLDEVRRGSADPESVTVDAEPHLRFITDRNLVVRGLDFLVDNALKYAGSCRIVARPGVIEVVDEGAGIPPEQRSRVFERFTRANLDTTIPGMGIGLPMARTLLAAAGAELTIEDGDGGRGCRLVARWD